MKYPSQNALQKAAELSQSMITKLLGKSEAGKKFAADSLFKLADALDVTAEWLYRGTGPMRKGGGEPKTPIEKAISMAHIPKPPITGTAIDRGLAHFSQLTDAERAELDVLTVFEAIQFEYRKEHRERSVQAEKTRAERERFSRKKSKPKAAEKAPRSERATGTGQKS